MDIPPGYALVGQQRKPVMGMGSQLPRIDRQESMFSQGRSFQPASNGSLGQVRLRAQGDVMQRRAFFGQTQTIPPTTTTIPSIPPPQVVPPTDKPEKPAERRRPAMRIAWGRLKKMDAQQLADTLAQVLERMKAKGIPPGMVEKIQARLAGFVTTGQETATVEITEPEVMQMEAEILSLEEAEAQDAGSPTPWLVGLGAAIGIGLLVNWLSD